MYYVWPMGALKWLMGVQVADPDGRESGWLIRLWRYYTATIPLLYRYIRDDFKQCPDARILTMNCETGIPEYAHGLVE